MKETYQTRYSIERMPSSHYGNPRYKLTSEEGFCLGTTRPDSSIAYGPVPNGCGKFCEVVVHCTPTGRRYIDEINVLPEIEV